MRVDLLTKEYPPDVYGGAGVHVTELARELRRHIEVQVRCFGGPREEADVTAYAEDDELKAANATLSTLGVDLRMAADCGGADLVHSHTWYANMGGHLAHLLHGIPHVLSAHSLEPLRPWKAEQLGGGYAVSSYAEKTAYLGASGVIAVSGGMRNDILRSYPEVDPDRVHVVHNGIDTSGWVRDTSEQARRVLEDQGIDPDRPTLVFVGRITRQKGLPYFIRAIPQLPADTQVVLCAGAPDTPEILQEVADGVAEVSRNREGVHWLQRVLPRQELCQVLSHATAFVCPSVYEPLGIVNLEAMACGAAVVGTATGGIPEVVVDGQTGWLVPIEQVQDGTGTPIDPDTYVDDLAATLTEAVSDPDRARRFGEAGLTRAKEHFSWGAIAERTLEVYRTAIANP